MIGHDFPYLDTRDLNLDWLLKKMKAVILEWASMQESFENLQENFDSLKEYVDNYFADLDLQDEVNQKLEEMLANGELDDLIHNDFLPLKFTRSVYATEDGATTIYYCKIPAEYHPKIRLADNEVGHVKTGAQHAYESKSTLLVNASTFNMATGVPRGLTIINGVTYTNEQITEAYDRAPDTLYYKDGLLQCVSAFNPNEELIAQNPDWALFAWYKFAENGVFTATTRDPHDYQPRTCIAQDDAGNFLLLCCDGRSPIEKGMALVDLFTAMTSIIGFIPRIAYNLDGGGSVAAIDHGIKVNKYIENGNRAIPVALYFGKDTVLDDNTFKINETIAYQLERGIREDARHTLNPQYIYHESNVNPMIRFMEIIKDGSDWTWTRGNMNFAYDVTGHHVYIDARDPNGDFRNYLKIPAHPANNDNLDAVAILGKLIGQFYDNGDTFTDTGVSSLDDLINSGFYMVDKVTAYPEGCPITSGRSICIVFGSRNSSASVETIQILTNGNLTCLRAKNSGVWATWVTLCGAAVDRYFSTYPVEYKNGWMCFDSTTHKTYTLYNGTWYDAMGNAR